MALEVTIRRAEASEADWCAQLMAANDPWLKYKLSPEWCRNLLRWPGSSLYMAVDKKAVGFILLHQRGFLGSPYIAAVVVAEEFRGKGIGSKMLEFAELAFSGARHVYICVSSFNGRAMQLYQRHGFAKIGDLPDFIADGTTELLMCKRLR